MSVMPFLLSDLLDDISRPVSLFDQNFVLGMPNEDLISPSRTMVAPLRIGYYRPWRLQATAQSGVSSIQNDKDDFKVNLEVQQFKPDEISVKTVDDYVVVEGKYEERQDEHGYISRQIVRRYKLPSDVEPETVASTLSSDGVLTSAATKKKAVAPANERVVSITHTQAPAVKAADGQGDAKGEKMEQ